MLKQKGSTMAVASVFMAGFFSYYVFFTNSLLGTYYNWFSDLPQSVVILLSTVPSLLQCLTSLLLGPILLKANKKAVMIFSMLCCIVGGLGIVLTGGYSFAVTMVCLILEAMGYTITINTSGAILVELNPGKSAELIGKNNAIGALGNMILTPIAGQLAATGVWSRVYYLPLLSILPLIALILFYHPAQMASDAAAGGKQTQAQKAITKEGIIRFVLIAIPFIFYTVGVQAWNQNFSSYIIVERQIGTAAEASMVSTFASAAGMLSGWFFVGPAKKLLKTFCVPVCLLGLAASFLTLAFGTNSLYLLYMSGFLFMTFFSPVTSSNFAVASKTLHAGFAISILRAIQSLATFASPYIINGIAAIFGDSIPTRMQCGIVMIVIAAVAFFPIMKKADNW